MVAISKSPVREGLPHPRGATWDGKGVNFALFSAHATRVEPCLFDETGETRIDLPEYTDGSRRSGIWDSCRRAIPIVQSSSANARAQAPLSASK
jgi:pullulanase/glycogen debranching enzyme